MKSVILTILAIILVTCGFSQNINSISILPANPENTDFIKVVVNSSMNTTDCWISTSSVTSTGNNHSIIGAHCSGLAQQVCTKSDTYNLGVLSAGTHDVSYDLFYGNLSSGQTQCSSFIFGDSLSMSFDVSNASGGLPIEIHPQGSHDICKGDSFYIHVDAFGQSTYKWLLNGTEIYSGTNHFIWAKDSGAYQVKAFANGDSGTSAAVLINVQSAPTDILAQTDYTLTTDYLSSSYQWHKIGVGPIIGADSHQIEITQNGEYFIELLSNAGCVGYSDTLYVELIDAFVEPSDSSVGCSNDSILLTAFPSGAEYSYQWFRDGFALSGAIQSTLIPFLSGQYKVSVSISQSIDTSQLHYAILHPSPTPTISYDGANLFSSKAFAYQWFLSVSGKINGANYSIHTPTSTGLYYVEVVDSNGCLGKSAGYAIVAVGIEDSNPFGLSIIQQNGWLHISHVVSKSIPFRIIDITGQQVYLGNLSSFNTTIEVGQWTAGVYIIQTLDNTLLNRKVIIH